jgi:hypothetical protein
MLPDNPKRTIIPLVFFCESPKRHEASRLRHSGQLKLTFPLQYSLPRDTRHAGQQQAAAATDHLSLCCCPEGLLPLIQVGAEELPPPENL